MRAALDRLDQLASGQADRVIRDASILGDGNKSAIFEPLLPVDMKNQASPRAHSTKVSMASTGYILKTQTTGPSATLLSHPSQHHPLESTLLSYRT